MDANNIQCKKSSFDTKEEASDRLKEIQEEGEDRGRKPIRFYRCDVCEKYHLTSMNRDKYISGVLEGGFVNRGVKRLVDEYAARKGLDKDRKRERNNYMKKKRILKF